MALPRRSLNSILVSFTVFVVVFGGAMAGIALQRVLPESQLGPEAKDIIRLAVGLLVTMTALVLGMLVSTANSSYQERKNELAEMASNVLVVDRLLATYGPETQTIRADLRRLAESSLERIWPSQVSGESRVRPMDDDHVFYDQLQMLLPKNDIQAAVKAATTSAAIGLRRTYWLMLLGSEQNSLSFPLLVVLVSWLTAIFISFGLFAPREYTVIVALVVCSLAVSAGVFIIMAMYMPFNGVMTISSLPLRNALSQMHPGSR